MVATKSNKVTQSLCDPPVISSFHFAKIHDQFAYGHGFNYLDSSVRRIVRDTTEKLSDCRLNNQSKENLILLTKYRRSTNRLMSLAINGIIQLLDKE